MSLAFRPSPQGSEAKYRDDFQFFSVRYSSAAHRIEGLSLEDLSYELGRWYRLRALWHSPGQRDPSVERLYRAYTSRFYRLYRNEMMRRFPEV